MTSVVIRPLERGDEEEVRRLLYSLVFEPFWRHWVKIYFSELSIQLTLLSAAMMFILLSSPLPLCLLSVPGVAALLLFLLYSYYLTVRKEKCKEVVKLWEAYNEDPKHAFWVAEALNEEGSRGGGVEIVREGRKGCHERCQSSSVVGTVGILLKDDSSMREPPRTVGLLTNLYVIPSLRRNGIGQELVSHAWAHCRKHLRAVELVVMEHQVEARRFIESQEWNMISVTEERLVPLVRQDRIVYRRPCVGILPIEKIE